MIRTIQLFSALLAIAAGAGVALDHDQPRVRAAFFAMTVPSMDATIAWYQDKLGLELRRRDAPGGGEIEQAHLVTAWLEVELFMPKNAPQGARPPADFGVEKIGVFVDEPTYTAILTRLRKTEAKFIGREMTEPDGSRFFMVEDNNSLQVQVFMVP